MYSIYSHSRVPYNQTSCIVCLTNYQEGETTVELGCGHVFHSHPDCFSIQVSFTNCPICRREIKENDYQLDQNALKISINNLFERLKPYISEFKEGSPELIEKGKTTLLKACIDHFSGEIIPKFDPVSFLLEVNRTLLLLKEADQVEINNLLQKHTLFLTTFLVSKEYVTSITLDKKDIAFNSQDGKEEVKNVFSRLHIHAKLEDYCFNLLEKIFSDEKVTEVNKLREMMLIEKNKSHFASLSSIGRILYVRDFTPTQKRLLSTLSEFQPIEVYKPLLLQIGLVCAAVAMTFFLRGSPKVTMNGN